MIVNMQRWMSIQRWQPGGSGAGCQVMAADRLSSSHGESGVLEGGGATQASLEAILNIYTIYIPGLVQKSCPTIIECLNKPTRMLIDFICTSL